MTTRPLRYACGMRFLAGAALVWGLSFPALAAEDPPPPAESAPNAQTDDEESPVDFHFRLRGRFLDEISDLGDIVLQRVSVWSHTNIGDRFQVRASWDLGEKRVHDLWARVDFGAGLSARVGRGHPAWLSEFTDAPFAFQMVTAANGAALTRVRETGVFVAWDRGPWNALFNVIAGNGFNPDENSEQDYSLSVGRRFEAGGVAWKLDAGHYEGQDGPDDALIPARQTGAQLDGDLGGGHFLRSAAFRREQDGRDHFGAFARFRKRWPVGFWGAIEVATESNHGPIEAPESLNSIKVGTRYELPWVLTHIAADYRWHFGSISDHEILVVFQWILDFRNPRRN